MNHRSYIGETERTLFSNPFKIKLDMSPLNIRT